jgi:hypothetical protein
MSSGLWNTTPIDGGGPCTTWPLTRTAPDVDGSSPATIFSSVLLPQPLGPTTATNSPSSAVSVISSSAVSYVPLVAYTRSTDSIPMTSPDIVCGCAFNSFPPG